ncbi:peptidase M24 [Candidatus Vecturithrix granuli]|uniref:Peptidase M24 n=1 Tax=Vecturithrix granuli TaxID=1499967 RepID=A0A081BXP1_VECG1|nr:peptidase M24 [Candidatus Vecturithrix granuli]
MLVQEKVRQAVEILQEFGVDCWMTFVRESELNGDPTLDYILGSSVTWHSAFILNASGQTYAIVGEFDRHAVEDTGAYTQVLSFVKSFKEPLVKCLQEINPAQIAVNYSEGSEICDGITHGMYLTLYKLLQEVGFENRLISAEKLVSALRQRKSATELEYIKAAIFYTEQIFEQAAAFIRPGITERELAEFMKNEVRKLNLTTAWNEQYCPAVFSGPEAVGGHDKPTDRIIKPGHLINIDFGVRYNGYCSDLQRTFYVLCPNETVAPAEAQKAFEDVMNAVEQAKQAIRSGIQGIEIDTIAREYLTSRGYEEFHCGLGHQVGRFAHDGTALLGPAWEKYGQKPFECLEPGMVFTLEPYVNAPGYGRATLEEMVIITTDGAEFLSTPQKELLIIRP